MTILATLCLTLGRDTFDKLAAVIIPWLLLILAAIFAASRWRKTRAVDRDIRRAQPVDVVRGATRGS